MSEKNPLMNQSTKETKRQPLLLKNEANAKVSLMAT